MRPKEPRVGDKWDDKCKLMRPKAPRVERQGGDKCKLMRPKEPRVGDKREASVNLWGTRHPEWETRGRQVYKAPRVGNKGDKCKLMRPKAPRGRQGGDKCKLMRPKTPRVGDKGEISVNSCGPRNPEWETRGRQV